MIRFLFFVLLFCSFIFLGGFVKRRILILDDDPVIHVSLMSVLFSDDIEVYSLHNSLDALRRLETSSVDLIICDIGLPRMNGLEFVRQLRTYP